MEAARSPDYQYEYDGQRLARGMFRLGFRSLVPQQTRSEDWSEEIGLFVGNEHGVFARASAPTVINWGISCSILIHTEDPFSKDEVVVDVRFTEPFTAAGRCRVSIRAPQSPLLVAGRLYDIVFRCTNNDRFVSPVIPPHPLLLLKGSDQEMNQGEDKEDWLSCCRLVVPTISWREPPRLIIGESASNLGIGGKVWDGSLAMLEFLFADEKRWSQDLGLPEHKGCKIVDLGSATGILGFGIALMKPQTVVINTDLPEIVPLLEMNTEKNHLRNRNCFAEAYTWGTDPDPKGMLVDIDVVMMCDVVYDVTCYKPLLDSLVKLRAKHVLMSHRHRNRSEIEFFQELGKIGSVECIKCPLISDDDPYQKILASIPLSKGLVVKENAKSTVDDVAVFRIRLI